MDQIFAPIIIKPTIGQNVLHHLSRNATSSPPTAIEDLAANSYEAGAKSVLITYMPARGSFVIEDNGTGMDQDGLESFFRFCDSDKDEEVQARNQIKTIEDKIQDLETLKSLTEAVLLRKQRKSLINFGLATKALRTIAGHMLLETWQNGTKYTVDHEFEPKAHPDEKYTLQPSNVKRELHGTRITLTKFKFSPDAQMPVTDLEKRLSLTMPIGDDFKIKINNTTLKLDLSDATFMQIDETLDKVGPVQGTLYLFEKARPSVSGIYLVVGDRVMGDPHKVIPAQRISMSIRHRMHARLHIPGLKDSVKMTRGEFHGSEEHTIVVDYLCKCVKQLRYHFDQATEKKAVEKGAVSNMDIVNRHVFVGLANAGIVSSTDTTIVKVDLSTIGPEHTAFRNRNATNQICVNVRSPYLNPKNALSLDHAVRAVTEEVILLLAQERAQAAGSLSLQNVLKFRRELLEKYALSRNAEEKLELQPKIAYDSMAAQTATGISKWTFEYVGGTKLLAETNHRYLGSDILALPPQITGYISFPHFAVEYMKQKFASMAITQWHPKLHAAKKDTLEPFITQLVEGRFFVPTVCAPLVGRWLKGYDGRRHEINSYFEKCSQQYMRWTEMQESMDLKSTGFTDPDPKAFKSYAGKTGFRLRSEHHGQEMFYLPDAVFALVHHAKNGNGKA